MFKKIDQEILDTIKNNDRFVITAHHDPDGDCLSSSIAFRNLLQAIQKDVILVNSGPIIHELIDEKAIFFDSCPPDYRKNSILIVLDCSSYDRIGNAYESIKDIPAIVIDHHATTLNKIQGLHYIDPSSPSTTLLVLQFFKELNIKITKMSATALFFGFATDSGFFRFLKNTQSFIFPDIQLLLESGADITLCYDKIYNEESRESKEYLKGLLSRYKIYDDICICTDDLRLLNKYGIENRCSDILFSQLLSIKEVNAVAFIKYKDTNHFSISLRSKNTSQIDVSKIAAAFGGGGHFHAAGFKSSLPLNKLKIKLKTLFSEA